MITSVVRVTLEGNRSPATIQGGPLATDTYELSEVVFRWGPSNCKGAEHTLNGTWFTMEAQAIHFNKRYETIERCWRENDGLAICSYFLQAYQIPTWDEHPSFSKITDDLYKITQYNSYAKIPASTLRISPPFFFSFSLFTVEKYYTRERREGGGKRDDNFSQFSTIFGLEKFWIFNFINLLMHRRLFELDETSLPNARLLQLLGLAHHVPALRMRYLDRFPGTSQNFGESSGLVSHVA